mgnify:CR=1 FL=1
MKLKKSRSVLTTSQQNGIFLFVGLIIVILSGFLYYNYRYPEIKNDQSIIDTLTQQKIDSLKIVKANADKKTEYKIYPFNPNFLKEGKAYRLGLSADEHDKLLNFRSQGNWINSVDDFQKVTGVSDELLQEISPYFKFPDWVIEQQNQKPKSKTIPQLSFEQKKDLNVVDAEDLEKINGVGEVLSKRIITYRNKIGKFRSDIQLKDVYGLKYEVIENITAQFTVKTNLDQPKININQASLIELAEVPYFDYELAREIFQFIKVNEGLTDFEELSKLQQFPTHKIDRIKLYLALN